MRKLLLLLIILIPYLSVDLSAQCPEAVEAAIINRVDNNDGTCSFDLELFYGTDGSGNASIKFTVAICGGAELYTTECYENLESASSPYILTLVDPALVANCSDEICVTYQSWLDATCNDIANDCTPANNEVTLTGSLPVNLISFDGNVEDYHKIKIEWVTETEENNAFFDIERSEDGIIFEKIGRVGGNGNTFSAHYYSFVDENPLLGQNYYRLKQVDYDEKYTRSEVILIKMERDLSTLLAMAPSVAKDEVDLVFHQLPRRNYMIEIFNSNGINLHNIPVEPSVGVVKLDISSYQPGMYFIRVPIGREFVIKKFVKTRD